MSLFDDPDARPPAPVPDQLSFESLREAIGGCRACELWERATQPVLGAGATGAAGASASAGLMLVGEQPGDREDIEGLPFVGPAGQVLDRGLLGSHVRIGRDRGRPMDSDLAELVTLTTHPSAILRQPGGAEREAAMDEFVADLSQVAGWLSK